MEKKIKEQCRGTRILLDENRTRRRVLNQLISIVEQWGFVEVIVPSIEPTGIYTDKAGKEILNQMYVFQDKKDRNVCLRPEVTATIQLLADTHFKDVRDLKLWYFEKCWRYERPQRGRYREFFQFGVEVLRPRNIQESRNELIKLGEQLIGSIVDKNQFQIENNVKRGLDYYINNGWEIVIPSFGPQKQVLGGGEYKQGIGFAIGFDRLMDALDD